MELSELQAKKLREMFAGPSTVEGNIVKVASKRPDLVVLPISNKQKTTLLKLFDASAVEVSKEDSTIVLTFVPKSETVVSGELLCYNCNLPIEEDMVLLCKACYDKGIRIDDVTHKPVQI